MRYKIKFTSLINEMLKVYYLYENYSSIKLLKAFYGRCYETNYEIGINNEVLTLTLR